MAAKEIQVILEKVLVSLYYDVNGGRGGGGSLQRHDTLFLASR